MGAVNPASQYLAKSKKGKATMSQNQNEQPAKLPRQMFYLQAVCYRMDEHGTEVASVTPVVALYEPTLAHASRRLIHYAMRNGWAVRQVIRANA